MATLVLYASQQGRSEEVARAIHAQGIARGLNLTLRCMDEIGSGFFVTVPGIYILVVSSTGDGEIPDNGVNFYKWLSTQDEGELFGSKYALLGLGDSNYFKYQCAPKKFDRMFDALGATAIVPRGAADDQEDLNTVIIPWVEGLWKPLKAAIDLLEEFCDAIRTVPAAVEMVKRPELVDARVVGRKVLSEKKAMKKLVELTIETQGWTYTPGVNLSVYPENDPVAVSEILSRLHFDPRHTITSESYLPQAIRWRVQLPISTFDFFLKYVEISGPVCKSFADYFCLSLIDKEEVEEIRGIIAKSRKVTLIPPYSLLHLVRTYTNFRQLYLEETLPILPPLRARLYSVSSSPLTSPNSLTIVFSVEGVCTSYMDSITDTDLTANAVTLPVSFGTGNSAFWKPIYDNFKTVVITTGVGISPFRAILEQLALTENRKLWIIHGCRQTQKGTQAQNFDFVYEREIKEFAERTGSRLDLAASTSTTDPKHVQDIIREKTEEIRRWSSVAVICGSFQISEMKTTLKSVNAGMTIVAEDWE